MSLRILRSGERTGPAPARPAVRVKVCGLTTEAQVEAAAAAGAAYLGLVFFARSPRAVTPAQARGLALAAPVGVAKVGLVVDASDAELDAILDVVPLDMIQLHGREPPERVAAVRARCGLPVIKALGVASPADLDALPGYAAVADQVLLDAKAQPGSARPGGNGRAFDWSLLAGRAPRTPWMLSGGLAPGNVAEAVRITGARQVDVSSGVESAPGVKDAALVRAFVAALA